jgi:hypothetical protein
VVINEFNVRRVAARPDEADSPLVVHANAVLVFAVAFELFQPVSRRNAQIIKRLCRIEDQQFSQCRSLNIQRQTFDAVAMKETLSPTITKTSDRGGERTNERS